MPVKNTLKTMLFTNGIGRIREWDLFVIGPEHILLSEYDNGGKSKGNSRVPCT
jgi:hypothetical protein